MRGPGPSGILPQPLNPRTEQKRFGIYFMTVKNVCYYYRRGREQRPTTGPFPYFVDTPKTPRNTRAADGCYIRKTARARNNRLVYRTKNSVRNRKEKNKLISLPVNKPPIEA